MERLLSVLLWFYAVFTDSRDPLVMQHRRLQRQALVSIGVSAILMVVTFIFTPSPSESPYRQVLDAATLPFLIGMFAILLASVIWCGWAAYALWRFERECGQ